jgi:hypothetical protein
VNRAFTTAINIPPKALLSESINIIQDEGNLTDDDSIEEVRSFMLI